MFYHVQVTQTIDLEPRHFGPGLKNVLFEKLVEKVEGTCSAKHGYIICVTQLGDVSQVCVFVVCSFLLLLLCLFCLSSVALAARARSRKRTTPPTP
jgi:hypothetical protein